MNFFHSINIIGAGRVGQTLGFLFNQLENYKVKAVCNQSISSSLLAIEFIAGVTPALIMPCDDLMTLSASDFILIATTDTKIEEVVSRLCHNTLIKPGTVVFHCSGFLSSDILTPLKDKGCFLASVHPMASFVTPALSVKDYSGTYCGMEGDEPALLLLESLFNAIGSHVYRILGKKSVYHAGGVFASNYLVTLAQQAFYCLQEAKIEEDIARSLIHKLMDMTLSNIKQTSTYPHALSGPLLRGDDQAIRSHLSAMDSEFCKKVYAILGEATLPLTPHEDLKKEQLKAALQGHLK